MACGLGCQICMPTFSRILQHFSMAYGNPSSVLKSSTGEVFDSGSMLIRSTIVCNIDKCHIPLSDRRYKRTGHSRPWSIGEGFEKIPHASGSPSPKLKTLT